MTYDKAYWARRNHKMPSVATITEYLDANPEFREMENSTSNILRDLWNNIHYWGRLTEKQEALAKRILSENAEREANKAAKRAEVVEQIRTGQIKGVPTGKERRVEGEVLSMKWTTSQFGTTLKMRVKSDEGWVVWGTVPSRWHDQMIEDENLHVGDKVAFYAALTASEDDPTFGFYSRPKMFKRTFAAPYTQEEVA